MVFPVTRFHQERIANANPLVNVDDDEINGVTPTQPLLPHTQPTL